MLVFDDSFYDKLDRSAGFIVPTSSYIFVSNRKIENDGFITYEGPLYFVGMNVFTGNLCIVEAKDPEGGLLYAGVINLNYLTLKELKSLLAKLPPSYELDVVILGNEEHFEEIKGIFTKYLPDTKVSFRDVIPVKHPSHVFVYFDGGSEIHYSVESSSSLPTHLLSALQYPRNPEIIEKALFTSSLVPAVKIKEERDKRVRNAL